MQSRVPLPTDNIYKFYSLFGLLILFISMWGFVGTYNFYSDKSFEIYEELEILKKVEKPSSTQTVRLDILEKKLEIYPNNKKFFMGVVGVGISIAVIFIFYGFFQWHTKIQPLQDKVTEKQLEKLDIEVKALKKQLRRVK